MNENLFDYTLSMQDVIYRKYIRTWLLFSTLFMIFVAFLFKSPPKTALIIVIVNVILFLILFPGIII